jgi:hypothetical protein
MIGKKPGFFGLVENGARCEEYKEAKKLIADSKGLNAYVKCRVGCKAYWFTALISTGTKKPGNFCEFGFGEERSLSKLMR